MTLAVRVIPCLDVKDGRVVKGVNFVDLIDDGDPVEAASAYDAAGADELCFLDITASSDNRETIFDVVARTAERCFMPLTVGGGVRAVGDIRKLLLAGAGRKEDDGIAAGHDLADDVCLLAAKRGVTVNALEDGEGIAIGRWGEKRISDCRGFGHSYRLCQGRGGSQEYPRHLRHASL